MHNTLEQALKYLTSIVNIQLLHVTDEDRIKVVLRALKRNDIGLPQSAIKRWLDENNWDNKSRDDFLKWAKAIESGGSVRLSNTQRAPSEKDVWQKISK